MFVGCYQSSKLYKLERIKIMQQSVMIDSLNIEIDILFAKSQEQERAIEELKQENLDLSVQLQPDTTNSIDLKQNDITKKLNFLINRMHQIEDSLVMENYMLQEEILGLKKKLREQKK